MTLLALLTIGRSLMVPSPIGGIAAVLCSDWAFLKLTHNGCRRKFHFASHQRYALLQADLSKCSIAEAGERRYDQTADIEGG